MKKHPKLFVGLLLSLFFFSTTLFYSCTPSVDNNSSNSNQGNTSQETTQQDDAGKTENPVTPPEETPAAKNVDCQITATDLGGDWITNVSIPAEKFSEMVSGDYITITTAASPTSSAEAQLKLCDGDWTNIGSDGACSNVSSFSSEYKCYTLSAAAQNTVFSPSDEVIATLKSKGMVLIGQGVKVTSVVIRINANLDVPETPGITSDLCDASATENAKHLFKYIKDMYGSKVITGQMENAWNYDCNMLQRVYDDTGKYPALMGFDFMNYTSMGYTADKQETERAIKFWNGKNWSGNKISDNQGIVAFCWHWRDPLAESGVTGSYKPGDGTDGTTTFRIPYDTETDSWNTTSAAYTAIMEDLDVIATELLRLQTAGVPVLWRPLHEGAGNLGGGWTGAAAWFWWGAGNANATAASTNMDNCAECYIALWKLMYNYFTETKGIHNLIWVWNGQNEKFYPGTKYVDIIGDDIYESYSSSATSSQVHNTNKAAFQKFQAWDSTKITTLSECGNLPDITTDGVLWSYFMIWNDGEWDDTNNCVSKNTHKDNFWSGEFFNSAEKKTEIYTSETAITLDELPDLTSY